MAAKTRTWVFRVVVDGFGNPGDVAGVVGGALLSDKAQHGLGRGGIGVAGAEESHVCAADAVVRVIRSHDQRDRLGADGLAALGSDIGGMAVVKVAQAVDAGIVCEATGKCAEGPVLLD